MCQNILIFRFTLFLNYKTTHTTYVVADGRDHTSCCRKRGVKTECLSMCSINIIGPLDPSLYVCIEDTAIIVMCFEEGLGGFFSNTWVFSNTSCMKSENCVSPKVC